jgi:hypothetical protein
MTESIEHRLQSSDPEEVYEAILEVGEQGHSELAGVVAPYLTSPTGSLRDAALRTLTFHLGLAEYTATALHALDRDADPDVRVAAAMGLARFASQDRDALARLLQIAVDLDEAELLRATAFLSALVAARIAAGIEIEELPDAEVIPGFDRKADWPLLARTLERAGMPVPPDIAIRAVPGGRPQLDVDRLHAMCEQLCRLSGGDLGEVAAALGLGSVVEDDDTAVLASPPAFAGRIVLSRYNGAFADLRIDPAGAGPSLAMLERRFGPGVSPPMAVDGKHVVRYDVAVAGAPWSCNLFAVLGEVEGEPDGDSISTELTLRRGRAPRATPVGDPLRALAALIARFDRTMTGDDDDRARSEAAEQIDQLREIAAAAMQGRSIGGFDVKQLDRALAVLAGWLREPHTEAEADARRAMADLESVLLPLLDLHADPAAEVAERAHAQQQARAAIAAYVAAHPIAPMRLPEVAMPPRRELPDLGSLDLDDEADGA